MITYIHFPSVPVLGLKTVCSTARETGWSLIHSGQGICNLYDKVLHEYMDRTWIVLTQKSDIMEAITPFLILPQALFCCNGPNDLPHVLGDVGRDFEAYPHSRGRFASKLQCSTNRSVDFANFVNLQHIY